MTERLSPTEIEITRRSLVMSPTLPGPTAESLLTEIQRLREQLEAVDRDLEEIEARVRRARTHSLADAEPSTGQALASPCSPDLD